MPSLRALAMFAAAVILPASAAHAACNAAPQIAQCSAALGEGYRVFNTYTLDGKGGETKTVTDDTVLSNRMTYQVVVCGGEGVGFRLSTASGEQVATATADASGQPLLTVEPARTTVHELAFALPAADTCAGAVLGVKLR